LTLVLLSKKHLSTKNVIISSIVTLCIWLYYLTTIFQKWGGFKVWLNWLFENAEPMLSVMAILFSAILIFKACFVILQYEKTKHSVKNVSFSLFSTIKMPMRLKIP
jgi:hypothetical protein